VLLTGTEWRNCDDLARVAARSNPFYFIGLLEEAKGLMNTTFVHTTDQNADFEGWAQLLICRKVPDDYRRLVDSHVIHDGADILKRGDAFEVRIRERRDGSGEEEILVTPFPD